ncbi:MAG: hypothetical protein PUC31_09800 [Bacteroidales bacterium]|nr:hypothetical protein [Bacteroidales bacterium]
MNRKIKLPPSHSTLSPIAAEGRKTQGGAEKIINLLIHDYLKLKIMTKKNETRCHTGYIAHRSGRRHDFRGLQQEG